MADRYSTHTPSRRPRISTFEALYHPSFRRLYPAAWLFYLYRMMEITTASWLVLEKTDSPLMVTLVGVSRLAPMLLLGMVAGSLADRFSKMLLMRGFQLVNLAIAAVLTLLVFIDAIAAWHIFPAMFITGVAWTVDFSSRRSFYSDLFADSRVVNAIALDSAAATGCNMLGPILAGAMIGITGYEGAFLFMCASSAVGFLMLSTVRAPYSRATDRRLVGVAEQVVESLKAVRSNQTLWAVVIVTICLNFFGFPFMQMVPVIAKDVLNVGELGFGILLAAVGIGSLSGTLLIATRGVKRPAAVFALGAMVMLTGISLFSASTVYLLSFLLLLGVGIGMAGFANMQSSITLQAAEPEMRGRAMGAVALGIGTAIPGLLIAGTLAETLGPQTALLSISLAGVAALALCFWRLPILRQR